MLKFEGHEYQEDAFVKVKVEEMIVLYLHYRVINGKDNKWYTLANGEFIGQILNTIEEAKEVALVHYNKVIGGIKIELNIK